MMIFDASRRSAELAHEVVIHQEALAECTQVRIGELAKMRGEPTNEPIDFLGVKIEEIFQFNFVGLSTTNASGNKLDSSLKKLCRTFYPYVITILRSTIVLRARVAHSRADRAATVG